jgi:acyl-CoA dehydrogenase
MTTYQAPLKDFNFLINYALRLDKNAVLQQEELQISSDISRDILEQADKLATNILFPLYYSGEVSGSHYHNGEVTTPEGFQVAYKEFIQGGWTSVAGSEKFGGMGLTKTIEQSVFEIISSANISFGLCPLLTQGAIHALEKWGTEEQKNIYLPRLISGQWSGTMNLTEPQSGSDLSLLTTKAIKQEDNSYKIFGTKIFITYGDHNLTENIIHLVLARLPDAPEGTKGISLFLVPKYLIDAHGHITQKNDVIVAGIEHKLGIHASPTCTMKFGENNGAVGYLVGEENQGLKAMFTMMNDARLSVATQGVAVSEIAFQKARNYAQQRIQGKSVPDNKAVTIIHHPDVQRNLVHARSMIFINRLLVLQTASLLDKHASENDKQAELWADFFIPIVKSWATDKALNITSDAIQIFGGTGYVEETAIACHLRDAKILSIYEGTNGIQAIDLITRKLCRHELGTFREICSIITEFATLCLETGHEKISNIGDHLELAAEDLLQAGEWMYQKWGLLNQGNEALAGAKPFLDLCAIVLGGYYAAKTAYFIAHHDDKKFTEEYQEYIDIAEFFAENYLSGSKSLSLISTRGTKSFNLVRSWL